MIRVLGCLLAMLCLASTAQAEALRLAVTTSFHNSGLSDILLPEIKADTDIDVQLLVVGTGQALKLGRAGDVDALLVHSRAAEEQFVAEGYAPFRRDIMYNDFVIIGPKADPAAIIDATSITQALTQIAAAKPVFISRGDESGTHRKELALWEMSNLDPTSFAPSWYREVGAGMGAALNTASGLGGYVLSDRASWLNFANKADLDLLFESDPALFNQYGFLPVSKDRHPHVKDKLAERLLAWLISTRAKELINGYQIDGQALFTFNAAP
jgi:tungstate transport system substrate-binding protein